jgi:hypothetical protein
MADFDPLSLTGVPPEVFCKIWQEMGIYDYEEIKKFAVGNVELIPVLNECLYRVDIDGNKSNFTSESLVRRLQILFDKSPYLKEVNLSNLSIKGVNTLLSFPKIKSVTNLHLDNVDYDTTYSVFDRMIELHKQYGEDFVFEVYHIFDEEEDDSYQIKYDHGTLLYDNINLDFTRPVEEEKEQKREKKVSDSSIRYSYLSQIVQQLRPHTIETYGAEVTTALMACDSIKKIEIKEISNEEAYRDSVSFELFIIANEKYMNIKYPDRADQINRETDEEGNVLTEEEMRELNMEPILELRNCSITSISYSGMVLDWFPIKYQYNYIYPTITEFLAPIEILDLSTIIVDYPNVKTFYYRLRWGSLPNREATLRKLNDEYPGVEFKQANELL